jgi:hypothetical protein
MVAYVSGRMRRLASERAKRVADRRGGRGKCVENRKKILNSGNEPKNLLKTQGLSFSGTKNELVFECKNAKTNSKKQPKNRLLCGIEVKFVSRKAPAGGRVPGGLHRLRKNSFGVSFRGAAGDEESRIVLKTLRARFLAPLGMTAWNGFSAACTGASRWDIRPGSPNVKKR